MADFTIESKNGINFLVNNNRVFLPSRNINVFPCSRRGQSKIEDIPEYYDPEARLNTERTNRIHTAINGFKGFNDSYSFVINNDFTTGDTLVFVLAGYRIEVKNFNPEDIAEALGLTDANTIYAHLSLHTGISLQVEDYFTDILYRQSNESTDVNYLDVYYEKNSNKDSFFVGVSFTTDETEDNLVDYTLINYNLPLFSKADSTWQLVQTSLLPKIEHDETENSIKISGDFMMCMT